MSTTETLTLDEARKMVADHAWLMGWDNDHHSFDAEPCTVAGEACGRLAAAKGVWLCRTWIYSEAAHEATAQADCGDLVTADAILTVMRSHLDTARQRRGSCTTTDLADTLEVHR